MEMELIFTDNIENILVLIKNNPDSILETFEFAEQNFNELLFQRLSNKLVERGLDVSDQLLKYHQETLSIEDNLLLLQLDLMNVLESITIEIENGNYDLYEWTIKYRQRFESIISKFCSNVKKEKLRNQIIKLYSKLVLNGLNSKKFQMMTNFIEMSGNYCKIRRMVSKVFGTEISEQPVDIQNNKLTLDIKIQHIFQSLEEVYAQINNQGILKMSFFSKDMPSQTRKEIIYEMDNIVSDVFKSLSDSDIDIVKQGIAKIKFEVKQQLRKRIVGMDKTVLSESMTIEGIFYRAVRYANQL